MKTKPQAYVLFNNSRFYVLVSAVLISISVLAYLRVTIPSDQLWYIRTQQTYGLLCILYWYVALIISPLGTVFGKARLERAAFNRRAYGVAAFYFATLHAGIALYGQLGGLAQLQYLPALFKLSLWGGLVALGILAIMAATSFDKVVRFMTFRRWKWLHRLVYAGGIIAVLHIWSIGTHLEYSAVQLSAFGALLLLSGLELYRLVKAINKKYLHFSSAEAFAMFIASWAVVAIVIYMIPTTIQSYHGRHSGEHSANEEAGH